MKKQTAEFSVNSQEEKNLLGTADALFCKYLADFCDIYTEMAEYEMDEDPMYDILHVYYPNCEIRYHFSVSPDVLRSMLCDAIRARWPDDDEFYARCLYVLMRNDDLARALIKNCHVHPNLPDYDPDGLFLFSVRPKLPPKVVKHSAIFDCTRLERIMDRQNPHYPRHRRAVPLIPDSLKLKDYPKTVPVLKVTLNPKRRLSKPSRYNLRRRVIIAV